MQGTCNEKGCKLFDLIGGTPEQCPNFVQTMWQSQDSQPILVKDCAPKRTMIMMQEIHNRLVGLQQASEQQRNESQAINSVFKEVLAHRIQKDNVARIEENENGHNTLARSALTV